MANLPTGTVTFLFTDIEGSTQLWEQHPDAMRVALARHDALAAAFIREHLGILLKSRGEGDSLFAVFARATDALAAVGALQRALLVEPWPTPSPLRVRIALHTGEAELREGDYYGPAVNRCARLRAAAHGGQVLLSQTCCDLVREGLPDEIRLRDLGQHRLKDLAHPERVFQLLHPDLPADFPPLRSLDTHPNNLPQQVTSFIGREKEMAEVKRLLASTRLLTLTGTGGTGKSRLAVQIAAEGMESYPDGVWLVELAPLSDPALVPQAVAAELGVREEAGRTLTQALVEFARPRCLLLLLDNCEHLLSACVQLADTFLRHCAQVTILASSREGLGIGGEQLYRVPSLSLPDPHQLPSEGGAIASALAQYEAVRLFIERAVAVQPSFTVTPSNALSLAEVCQRLDGIPLAIELAAARVRALPAEQIAARLNDRFRLLTGGSRAALPRQQTLRALIDWSYDLLSEPEQVLLRRLSVFTGGWDLEAAESVGEGEGIEAWEVLDLLTSLVDKSLLIYEEREGAARYRLLETVRQYARDRLLEAGEAERVRERHRDCFLRWAEEAEPRLHGAEQARWSERFAQEHDNLRAALEWSLADDAAPAAALRLAGAAGQFWRRRLYLTEGEQWLRRALEHGKAASPAARAKGLFALADLLFCYWDATPAVIALFEESVALYRSLGESRGLGRALIGLGYANKEIARDYAKARSCFEEALTVLQQTGDQRGIGMAHGELGLIARDQGDLDTARAFFRESVALIRQTGDWHAVAWALHGAGTVAWRQGDRQEGRILLEESRALRREIGDIHGLRWLLWEMGDLFEEAGEHEAMETVLGEQLTLSRHAGDQGATVRCLNTLARLACERGDYAEARSLLEQSLAFARQMGNERLMAFTLNAFGQMAREQGEFERAISHYEESLTLCEGLDGSTTWVRGPGWIPVGWVLHNLGQARLATEGIGRAATLFAEGLRSAQSAESRIGIAANLAALAGVASDKGEARRAAVLLGAAQPLMEVEGARIPGVDQDAFERHVAAARAALAAEAFSAAWEEGQAMSLEEAVACALGEQPDA